MVVVNSNICLKSSFCILAVVVFFIAVFFYFSPRRLSVATFYPERQGSTVSSEADPHITPHTRYNPLSYVVALEYADQLGGAVLRFGQLLVLASRWNRHGVEPFVIGSGLQGIPRDTSIPLGNVYNLSYLEDCEDITRTISSFENFLVNSTRELVWLNFVKGGKKSRDPCIYDCNGDHNAIAKLNVYLESVKDKAVAKHGKDYKFKLVKAVCVEAEYSGFALDDLERAVSVTAGSEHVRTSTLVIPFWVGLENRSGGYDFYTTSKFACSLINDQCCNIDTIPRTTMILNASDKFIKSLKLSGPFIGVHFRIERLMLMDRDQRRGRLDQCIEKFGIVIQDMMRKYNVTSESVIAVNDYNSDYGTQTCSTGPWSKCINVRNKVVKRLESWGIRTVRYDPALFNTQRHKGFVSLVEKETLSSANYFFGVGGGTYQNGIEHLFVKKHGGEEDLYRLCSMFGTPDRLPDPKS